jgi:hypothetical protein
MVLALVLLAIDVAGWWLAWAVTHPVHGPFTEPFTNRSRCQTCRSDVHAGVTEGSQMGRNGVDRSRAYTAPGKPAGQARADRSRWNPARSVHEAFTRYTAGHHNRRSERSRTVHAVHAADRSRPDPLLWRGGPGTGMDCSQP